MRERRPMSQLLEAVYREHRKGLYSLAVTVTASHQLAEDAVHNAFERMIRTQMPSKNLVAYVYRAVRNAAIDLRRKDQTQDRLCVNLFEEARHDQSSSADPTHQLMTKETHQQLRQSIASLAENYREAIVLKAFAGLTFDQIGIVTGNSAKTIATRYRRAIDELQNKLSRQLF